MHVSSCRKLDFRERITAFKGVFAPCFDGNCIAWIVGKRPSGGLLLDLYIYLHFGYEGRLGGTVFDSVLLL